MRLLRWLISQIARWVNGNVFCPGYAMPLSDKIDLVLDHPGPTSYANTAVFSTSGEVLNASDYGIGGIEMVAHMDLTGDGLYYVKAVFQDGAGNNLQSAATGASAKYVLHWYVAATNAEVANGTNLNSSFIRLNIRGV